MSDGRPYGDNPCLAKEYTWGAAAPAPVSFYMNTANPGSQSVHWTTPGPKSCDGTSTDVGCAYNYGWNAAEHAFNYALGQTGAASQSSWWLDVETANTWSMNSVVNNADLQGAIDYFESKPLTVGIYTTPSQWGTITGGQTRALPNWVPGASTPTQAMSWCTPSRSITGGPVSVVQYPAQGYDGDIRC